MLIWTGLLIGFIGSVHCVGMCGPIVLMLPTGKQQRGFAYFTGRVLYNFGRVITYTFMGVVAGVIGESLSLGGFQQTTSIVMGIIILIAILLPKKVRTGISSIKIIESLSSSLKTKFQKHFGNASFKSLFSIGILNGFLPCGFVYFGLAGSIAAGSIYGSAAYMFLFGVGTIPILIATSYSGKIINIGLRRKLNRLIPAGMVIIALLFILRGLSLGVPYISPKSKVLQTTNHMQSDDIECKCH